MTLAEAQRRREGIIDSSAPQRLCVRLLLVFAIIGISPFHSAYAQKAALTDFAEPGDESAQYTIETLKEGLDNPCGLAVRPNLPAVAPFEIYFSESGAGRVVRVITENPADITPVVTGFPKLKLGQFSPYEVGPLGIEFITRTKLAVGTGGLGEGKDLIRVYSAPGDGKTLNYDQADYSIGPVASDSRTTTGQGRFFDLVRIEADFEKALYATSIGDPKQGWLLKASAGGNRLADLQTFIAAATITAAGDPMAVTINPKPRSQYLLVGQIGEAGEERDSVVGYYGPVSGTPALLVKCGLYDVVGLAYSPGGDLYALDFAWHESSQGGLYRLDAAAVDGRESCRPVRIAAIERPTSLAFTPDGSLYITAFGTREPANDKPTGKLLKITPRPEAKL
jgi:hypothetical protein